MENAELEFTETALREVAKVAIEKDTGARGLRSVMEQVMFDLMYELPDRAEHKRYLVTPEMVRGEKPAPPADSAAA
jgi:ATP-dependent Clp protease ATP-binding subunit ClpX